MSSSITVTQGSGNRSPVSKVTVTGKAQAGARSLPRTPGQPGQQLGGRGCLPSALYYSLTGPLGVVAPPGKPPREAQSLTCPDPPPYHLFGMLPSCRIDLIMPTEGVVVNTTKMGPREGTTGPVLCCKLPPTNPASQEGTGSSLSCSTSNAAPC